jgi:protein-disulfide isomerase
MKMNIIAVGVGLVSASAGAWCNQVSCLPFPNDHRTILIENARRTLGLPADVGLRLKTSSTNAETCFQELSFSAEGLDQPFQFKLYLSPDRRFLLRQVVDTAADLEELDKRTEGALDELEKSAHLPWRGKEHAAVQLTIFTDFQCPFCQALERQLQDNTFQNLAATIHVREIPLAAATHTWGRQATRSALCLVAQRPGLFWEIQDALLRKHDGRTADGRNDVEQIALNAPGVNTDQYRACISNGYPDKLLDTISAKAAELGVVGTPALYLNGRPLYSVSSAEQLAKMIHQLTDETTTRAAAKR